MGQNTTASSAQIKCHSSVGSFQTIARTRKQCITKLQRKILAIYYETRVLGVHEADYSLEELSVRLKRHPKYISTNMAELERAGLMESSPHGSGNKRRWITLYGYTLLDEKPLPQILPQINATPYIDLLDQDINTKIIREAPICGQLQTNPIEHLDHYLALQGIASRGRMKIKRSFENSRIGPHRTEKVIHRMMKANIQKTIKHPEGYLLKCILNEQKELENLFKVFKGKNVSVRMYNYSL